MVIPDVLAACKGSGFSHGIPIVRPVSLPFKLGNLLIRKGERPALKERTGVRKLLQQNRMENPILEGFQCILHVANISNSVKMSNYSASVMLCSHPSQRILRRKIRPAGFVEGVPVLSLVFSTVKERVFVPVLRKDPTLNCFREVQTGSEPANWPLIFNEKKLSAVTSISALIFLAHLGIKNFLWNT
jgi:hypothetical protein